MCGLVLVGCGRPSTLFEPVKPHDVHYVAGKWVIDPNLADYVTDYLDALSSAEIGYGHIDLVSSVMCVKHIEDVKGFPTVGLTLYTANWGVQVLVNCSYQDRYTEEIVYHELTHAFFDLAHSKDPKSIHYWQVPNYDEVKDDTEWYARVDSLMEFIKRGGDE